MKKIITILLIIVLSFGSTFAYSATEFESKKIMYKIELKKKIATKLEKINEKKLKKIVVLINTFIIKYKNNKNISEYIKLKKIAVLTAFKEIVEEKLEQDYSDIKTILETVNKKIEVVIINDKRCGEKCTTTNVVYELKKIIELKEANFINLDFSEEKAKLLLKESSIIKLPAVLFIDNKISELKQFLKITTNSNYKLELGSTFNPYEKRSDKGFKVIDKNIISKIKNNSYIKGDFNSTILWLEYSDMECPYCSKLHNNGTLEDLEKKYKTKLSYSLQHFPLGFHKNALPAAEALECTAKQEGSEAYYELGHIIFKNKNTNIDFIIKEAVKLGADEDKLKKCIENKDFEYKIKSQQKLGTEIFGITGTPGNVLINTKTGEYEVISGAYPTSSFIKVIDKLLK